MSETASWVWLNGDFVEREEAFLPAESSGLFYGAGCFETMLSERGSIFRFSRHFSRLLEGLIYLGVKAECMPIEDRLLEVIQRLLSLNSYNDVPAKVRIQASLKTKGGYKNDDPDQITLLITADRALPGTSVKKMIVSDTRVVPKECKPAHLKLSNMLHYRQAAREAQKAGVDDAVMLTTEGLVAESSIANIFWKREDKIYTPSEACDILPGITRNSLLELLDADDDYCVTEGEFQIEDLQKADAAWLTNSVMGIVPVSEINGRRFNNQTSFFHQLTDRFKTFKRSGG